tara:strand:+ start:2304 stop:2765 length:462 start_codon:yes stop_codon:yes gene_type:complete
MNRVLGLVHEISILSYYKHFIFVYMFAKLDYERHFRMEVELGTHGDVFEGAAFQSHFSDRVTMLQFSNSKPLYFGRKTISTGLCTHAPNYCASTVCKALFFQESAHLNYFNVASDRITQIWDANNRDFIARAPLELPRPGMHLDFMSKPALLF